MAVVLEVGQQEADHAHGGQAAVGVDHHVTPPKHPPLPHSTALLMKPERERYAGNIQWLGKLPTRDMLVQYAISYLDGFKQGFSSITPQLSLSH